jgi:hypothetical protein
VASGASGVVHQYVHISQLIENLGGHSFHLGRIGYIADHRDRLAAPELNLATE